MIDVEYREIRDLSNDQDRQSDPEKGHSLLTVPRRHDDEIRGEVEEGDDSGEAIEYETDRLLPFGEFRFCLVAE